MSVYTEAPVPNVKYCYNAHFVYKIPYLAYKCTLYSKNILKIKQNIRNASNGGIITHIVQQGWKYTEN